jgi:hypothetical protein
MIVFTKIIFNINIVKVTINILICLPFEVKKILKSFLLRGNRSNNNQKSIKPWSDLNGSADLKKN